MKMSTKIERRQRRFKRLLSLLFAITFTVILIGFSLNSEIFNINKIKVQGNINLTRERLLHTSSINIGENIFRISIKDAEENILKLPYVKSVKISRKLPRGIHIEVIEREHKLLVKDISMYYILDEEGYVLNEIDSNIENLPVVLGLKADRIVLGDNLFLNMEIQELEDFINESENLNILNILETIDIENQRNVNILINNGIKVAFGPLSNVKYKISLLNEILIHSQNNDILIKEIIMNRGEHPIIVLDD